MLSEVIKLKNSVCISIFIYILLFTLAGCITNGEMAESNVAGSANTGNIDGEDLEDNAAEVRWAAVPAVYVNDTYFRIYADEHHHPIPDLDDSWVLLGVVQSAVPGWESPIENFQTNNELMIGSEIYFSSEGRIPVTTSTWGDSIDEEVIGDSVIIVFENSKLLYIRDKLVWPDFTNAETENEIAFLAMAASKKGTQE